MTTRKIVFLTGTRADFGKLKPLIEKVDKCDDFECYVFVTGMHTLSEYGSTFIEVQRQHYDNIFIFMNQTNSTDSDVVLSNTISGFGNFVKEIKPDLIVIHGDRIEAMAGAIAGLFNNILVAHIEGGELSGTVDEIIRHTISKLSSIHFVANKQAQQRLIQMGESKDSIFVIGSPDIDIMKSDTLPSLTEVKRHYQIPFDKYAILIFHPVTTELEHLKNDIQQIVSAIIKSNRHYVVIYPNNDPGYGIIFKEYKKLSNNNNFKIYPSLRFEYFLTLLKNSSFIIGNSSAGVREASVYGVPTINIGSRQKNRTQNPNILNVSANEEEILGAIDSVEGKKFAPIHEFGDGKSANRFFEILTGDKVWQIRIQKQFVDLDF